MIRWGAGSDGGRAPAAQSVSPSLPAHSARTCQVCTREPLGTGGGHAGTHVRSRGDSSDSERSPLPAPPTRCLSEFLRHPGVLCTCVSSQLLEAVTCLGHLPSTAPHSTVLGNTAGDARRSPSQPGCGDSSPGPGFWEGSRLSPPAGHRCHLPSPLFGAPPSKCHTGNGTQPRVRTTAAQPGGTGDGES